MPRNHRGHAFPESGVLGPRAIGGSPVLLPIDDVSPEEMSRRWTDIARRDDTD
jgi:hypothetical protein